MRTVFKLYESKRVKFEEFSIKSEKKKCFFFDFLTYEIIEKVQGSVT